MKDRLLPLLLIGSIASAACSNDLDSLYGNMGDAGEAPKDAGMHGSVAIEEPPALPALPDPDRRDACEACAAERCGEPRQACLGDPACLAALRCAGKCADPACLAYCDAEHPLYRWGGRYADYWGCVFGGCPSECNTGANWQCKGAYRWPSAETTRFKVRFHFEGEVMAERTRPVLTGATVRACGEGRECGSSFSPAPLDSQLVGLDNTVELELAAPALAPRNYRGYLELEAPDAVPYGEYQRLHFRPLFQDGEISVGFLPSDAFWIATVPIDLQRARVSAAARDCLNSPAPGLRISLLEEPEIAPLYATEAAIGGLAPGEQTGTNGVALFPNLPDSAAERQQTVCATLPDDTTVAQRSVWVRPGYSTFIILMPAARGEPGAE